MEKELINVKASLIDSNQPYNIKGFLTKKNVDESDVLKIKKRNGLALYSDFGSGYYSKTTQYTENVEFFERMSLNQPFFVSLGSFGNDYGFVIYGTEDKSVSTRGSSVRDVLFAKNIKLGLYRYGNFENGHIKVKLYKAKFNVDETHPYRGIEIRNTTEINRLQKDTLIIESEPRNIVELPIINYDDYNATTITFNTADFEIALNETYILQIVIENADAITAENGVGYWGKNAIADVDSYKYRGNGVWLSDGASFSPVIPDIYPKLPNDVNAMNLYRSLLPPAEVEFSYSFVEVGYYLNYPGEVVGIYNTDDIKLVAMLDGNNIRVIDETNNREVLNETLSQIDSKKDLIKFYEGDAIYIYIRNHYPFRYNYTDNIIYKNQNIMEDYALIEKDYNTPSYSYIQSFLQQKNGYLKDYTISKKSLFLGFSFVFTDGFETPVFLKKFYIDIATINYVDNETKEYKTINIIADEAYFKIKTTLDKMKLHKIINDRTKIQQIYYYFGIADKINQIYPSKLNIMYTTIDINTIDDNESVWGTKDNFNQNYAQNLKFENDCYYLTNKNVYEYEPNYFEKIKDVEQINNIFYALGTDTYSNLVFYSIDDYFDFRLTEFIPLDLNKDYKFLNKIQNSLLVFGNDINQIYDKGNDLYAVEKIGAGIGINLNVSPERTFNSIYFIADDCFLYIIENNEIKRVNDLFNIFQNAENICLFYDKNQKILLIQCVVENEKKYYVYNLTNKTFAEFVFYDNNYNIVKFNDEIFIEKNNFVFNFEKNKEEDVIVNDNTISTNEIEIELKTNYIDFNNYVFLKAIKLAGTGTATVSIELDGQTYNIGSVIFDKKGNMVYIYKQGKTFSISLTGDFELEKSINVIFEFSKAGGYVNA